MDNQMNITKDADPFDKILKQWDIRYPDVGFEARIMRRAMIAPCNAVMAAVAFVPFRVRVAASAAIFVTGLALGAGSGTINADNAGMLRHQNDESKYMVMINDGEGLPWGL